MIEVIELKIERGYFIKMDKMAAIKTIHSLTAQIITGSPNAGRWEAYTIDGKEFTIAVVEEEK